MEGERRISIRMRVYQEFLCIEVSNPIAKNQSLEFIRNIRTTKKDIQHHGYGRKIISSIVKKYNGTKNDEIENGIYRVNIMLSMPNKGGEEL
jgi:sensor histidine kinase regulating citrate/malate metabolism